MVNIVKTHIYLHSSDEYLFDKGLDMKMEEEAAENFAGTAYEVRLDLDVDLDTGKAWCTHFEGISLVRSVEI